MIGLQSVTGYSRTTEARRETRDLVLHRSLTINGSSVYWVFKAQGGKSLEKLDSSTRRGGSGPNCGDNARNCYKFS